MTCPMATPAADCSAIRRSCSHGVSSSSVRYFWSAHLAAWPGGLPGGPALAPTGPVARTPHRAVVSLAPITGVGLVIGLLTRWLGNPGDVELLVDNIHVIGRPESARSLRSLIPVSLLGIAVGGAAGPEAPLAQTTGTLGSTIALRAGRSPDGVGSWRSPAWRAASLSCSAPRWARPSSPSRSCTAVAWSTTRR